jgi:hypothetical protein
MMIINWGRNSNYSVPATYTFERNNTTTVDFSGQSSRLLMLEEMGNIIKLLLTQASQSVLTNMYSNTKTLFKYEPVLLENS